MSPSRGSSPGAPAALLLSLALAATALEASADGPETTGDPAPAGAQIEPAGDESVVPVAGGSAESWLVVRTAFRNGFAFRLVEAVVVDGRWIRGDFGYFDGGHAGEYRQMWIGGGAAVVALENLAVELKGAFSWTDGSASAGERYFLTNAYLEARPRSGWTVELSYTESYPLDREAVRSHFLDRARLEYRLGRHQLGVGYAGYRASGGRWEHQPFVSFARTIRGLGEVELWLQRVERPQGPSARFQLRLARRLSR